MVCYKCYECPEFCPRARVSKPRGSRARSFPGVTQVGGEIFIFSSFKKLVALVHSWQAMEYCGDLCATSLNF